MCLPVEVVPTACALAEAARRMVARAVAWLVVVDGDKPVGSLGGQDVLRAVLAGDPAGQTVGEVTKFVSPSVEQRLAVKVRSLSPV